MGIKIKLNKNSHNTKSKIRNSYRLYNPKLITEYQSPLPELRIKPKIGRNGRRKPDCTVHAVCHASSAATAVVAAPAAAASGGCCWWCWWRDGEAEVVAWAVLAWWRWLVRTDRDKDKKRKKKKKKEMNVGATGTKLNGVKNYQINPQSFTYFLNNIKFGPLTNFT